MSTKHRLPQYSLPPPGTARALPPASLVLFDGDVLAVWIRGRAVGFGGFPDERAAADAALVAYAALSSWVDRRRYTPPPLPATLRPTVGTCTCGGQRWVLADRLPIARLVDARSVRVEDACAALSPAPTERWSAWPAGHEGSARAATADDPSGPHHGFEVEVPLPVDELGVRSAAYAVYRALCRSGLPWRLWDAGDRARHVRIATDDADAPAETGARRRARPRGQVQGRTAPAHDGRRAGAAQRPDDASADAVGRPLGSRRATAPMSCQR